MRSVDAEGIAILAAYAGELQVDDTHVYNNNRNFKATARLHTFERLGNKHWIQDSQQVCRFKSQKHPDIVAKAVESASEFMKHAGKQSVELAMNVGTAVLLSERPKTIGFSVSLKRAREVAA